MPYLGINDVDKTTMLKSLGIHSTDELFMDIPEPLLLARKLNLEAGYSEWDLERYFEDLGKLNHYNKYDFKGAGVYRHHVPALVRAITNRGEFLTAYTPYQAEVSQGTLEAIYKFQTYITELTGMSVCNASMYDGATAFAEALMMAYRIDKRRPIYLSATIHPEYIEVAKQYLGALDLSVFVFESLDEVPDSAIVALQNPDFYGERLSDAALIASKISQKNLFLVYVVVEALSLTLGASPSDYGARIVAGSAQSFGNPLHYGGAQIGFLACTDAYIRQLPGRLVGKTTDKQGREGFVLTFQAREQHIKRERASSNICTNQSIHALAAAIYISQMGASGLQKLGIQIYSKANALKNALAVFPEIKVLSKNIFNEFAIETEQVELAAYFSEIAVKVQNMREGQPQQYLIAVSELHQLRDLNQVIERVSEILSAVGVSLPRPHINDQTLSTFSDDIHSYYLRDIQIDTQSELSICRLYTRLSQKNFSIDTNFYPLGSCTMKYNPKINDCIASSPAWTDLHPYSDAKDIQGALLVYEELNKSLCEITGMHQFSLMPSAGAHGELAALLMAKKYFADTSATQRNLVLVPDSAHGTNPASASMAGFETITIRSLSDGDVDLEHLREIIQQHSEKIAVFMLTNPSTLGLFVRNITEVVRLIHEAGALLYYDGANLNAIAGIVRPGDMGFDLIHLNLHKTFSTPHGGGGPGAGPVGASKALAPYLPGSSLQKDSEGRLSWAPLAASSIGRIRSFHGNFNVLIRALAYIKRNGAEGIRRIAETATLNANYIQQRIFTSPILSQNQILRPYFFSEETGLRICKHEFILSASRLKEIYGITALDIAKRLLDFGIHAPTIYFPLTVPEALMIEPTETESLAALDSLVQALETIILEAASVEGRKRLEQAPLTTELARFDEVKAVRHPLLNAAMERRSKLESVQ